MDILLEEYKKYQNIIHTEPIPDTDVTQDKEYVCTLLGRDYLSVAHARGAQHIPENFSTGLMGCYQ